MKPFKTAAVMSGLLTAALSFNLFLSAQTAKPKQSLNAESFARLSRDFQAKLNELREQYGFPGATAAFVLPDGRLYGCATGLADKEKNIPFTPQTRLMSASIGKTFVAAVALSLVQEGRLALDDRIEKYFGSEPWFARLPNGREITLRHLLTHSSGLGDHVYSEGYRSSIARMRATGDPDFYFRPVQLVEFVCDQPPLFAPGKGYKYTDTGYILVGLIIEKVSGRRYYDLLTERFLKPLRLTLTRPSNQRKLPGLAAGYLAEQNHFNLPVKIADFGEMKFNPAGEWTGGGLVTNSQDLARWAKILYEGRALKKPYLDDLIGSAVPREPGSRNGYGLGVFINETPLGKTYGHTGWYPGYRSFMIYFPEAQVAVAMQINTDADMKGGSVAVFSQALAGVVLGALR